jgi:hypothetical protein
MKIKLDLSKRKMGSEELQSYLKAKRLGNGAYKNKKAYDRKRYEKIK